MTTKHLLMRILYAPNFTFRRWRKTASARRRSADCMRNLIFVSMFTCIRHIEQHDGPRFRLRTIEGSPVTRLHPRRRKMHRLWSNVAGWKAAEKTTQEMLVRKTYYLEERSNHPFLMHVMAIQLFCHGGQRCSVWLLQPIGRFALYCMKTTFAVFRYAKMLLLSFCNFTPSSSSKYCAKTLAWTEIAYTTALELNFGLPISNLVLCLTNDVCKALNDLIETCGDYLKPWESNTLWRYVIRSGMLIVIYGALHQWFL